MRDRPTQHGQSAMLQRFDCAGWFAEDLGGLCQREIGDDPQQQHVALIVTEQRQELRDVASPNPASTSSLRSSTSQIQRNNVGERVLGLPKEPKPPGE